jgi:RNA polymerase sigma factor (sigma-70 family)
MMTDPFGVNTTSSDAELITAARAGDAPAYGMLYERHAEAARRLARQIVSHPADVDDVVAETFTKVLSTMKRGAGPSEAFRPYLLTAVRRIAYDRVRDQRGQVPVDAADLPDPGEQLTDPAIASLERSLVARAFRSLPERWSAVLWHTEVERARPAEVALLLGITPNGVAALSYRAREGLRQAYLQMHLSTRARAECQPVTDLLGAHVRGALSSRQAYQVESHLRGCDDCLAARTELAAINGALRGVLAPAVLGGQAAAYLTAGGHSAAAVAGGGMAMWPGRTLRWLLARRPPEAMRCLLAHRPPLPVAAGVALTAIMLPAAFSVLPHLSTRRPSGTLPAGVALPPGTNPNTRTGGVGPSPAERPSPEKTHGRSPEPSPKGSPSLSPSGSPSPSPTGSPKGFGAQISVSVSVEGVLHVWRVAVVMVEVSDTGDAASKSLTLDLTLPPGTVELSQRAAWRGWTCSPGVSAAATCTHAAIAPGDIAALSFRFLVVSRAGCGKPVLVTVTSGSLTATATSLQQDQCDVP